MAEATIFHNPSCGTSRNTLALLRHAGIEPTIIEYVKTPPTREQLGALIDAIGIPVRDLLRRKGAWRKLCRPSEAVLELLPDGRLPDFTKEDGEVVVDSGARRS